MWWTDRLSSCFESQSRHKKAVSRSRSNGPTYNKISLTRYKSILIWTLLVADTLPCWSVGRSVCPSVHHIFEFRRVFALLLLPNCPRLDCRVSGYDQIKFFCSLKSVRARFYCSRRIGGEERLRITIEPLATTYVICGDEWRSNLVRTTVTNGYWRNN